MCTTSPTSVGRGRLAVLLALLSSLGLPMGAQSPMPGTYRLWLCEQRCALADSASAAVIATIVIVDDSAAASDTVQAAFRGMRVIRRVHETAPRDNVCFRVTSGSGRIGGEELFFGIHSNAVTRWQYSAASGFTLRVYLSPDAGYTLRWSESGPLAKGEGWSFGWSGDVAEHRNAYFVATRTGPADISSCELGR